MKITPTWIGRVQNNKLELADPEGFKRHVATLKGEIELIIRKPRKERSSAENRYYWSVVIRMIYDETGQDRDDVHEYLKKKFGLKKQIRIGKSRLTIIKSTTEYSTIEFEDYLEQIRVWAAHHLAMRIPLPREVDY